MSLIDRFIAFANALPADRRAPVEEALGSIMATYDREAGFSGDELAQLDQRLAESRPEYSPAATIATLLGKPFG